MGVPSLHIYTDLSPPQRLPHKKSWTITIGNFDGVHLGHRYLLSQAKKRSDALAVITFRNHPLTVLKNITIPSLASLDHKLLLLKRAHVNLTFALEFSYQLASLTAKEFLTEIKRCISFDRLVLGEGAVFGKNRDGTETEVKKIAKELNFHVEYVPKFCFGGEPISSRRIRDKIVQGELSEASLLLGRRYSLFVPCSPHISLSGFCLPPAGSYLVSINGQKERIDLETSPPQLTLTKRWNSSKSLIEIIF